MQMSIHFFDGAVQISYETKKDKNSRKFYEESLKNHLAQTVPVGYAYSKITRLKRKETGRPKAKESEIWH